MLIAAALLIRAAFIVFYRIDCGWSHGLVQYRDLFDNHFPLLHLLFAPLMRVMPETSATFWWMRLAIAPIAIACSWLLFVIGKALVGPRRAAIAAIVFSVMPPWLAKSVEFRNDTLWIFFWLAAIALAMSRRPFLAGIAASLCLLASVKAIPLAAAAVFHRVRDRQPHADEQRRDRRSRSENIAAHRCCVAIADATHIPPRTRAFLNDHFVRYGPLRVCGATPRDGAFTIAVPQTYSVVARDASRVAIDGVRYDGPRFLGAGRHTLTPTNDRVSIIWSGVSAKEDAGCRDSHTLAAPGHRSPLCGAFASMALHTR